MINLLQSRHFTRHEISFSLAQLVKDHNKFITTITSKPILTIYKKPLVQLEKESVVEDLHMAVGDAVIFYDASQDLTYLVCRLDRYIALSLILNGSHLSKQYDQPFKELLRQLYTWLYPKDLFK